MSGSSVGSVARAIALLDAVAESDGGARVVELARRIGVNPSTASRLLSTLEAGGLIERADGGPYRLGLKLVALSDRVLGQLDVRERARPWLTWLVKETGETATLSVPGGELVAARRLRSTSCPRPPAWSAWLGSGARASRTPPPPARSASPAARLPAATRRDLRDPLLRAAREVSQSLGGPG